MIYIYIYIYIAKVKKTSVLVLGATGTLGRQAACFI